MEWWAMDVKHGWLCGLRGRFCRDAVTTYNERPPKIELDNAHVTSVLHNQL